MQSSTTAAHVLPSTRTDQKVEVVLENNASEERVLLRYSTWTEGLGWCCQKTIRLDAGQLEDLQRALTVARHRIGRKRAENGQAQTPAQVIQMPSLS